MIILLSPAKTFNNYIKEGKSLSVFQEEINYLLNILKTLNLKELQTIFKTSDKLTLLVRDYYLNFKQSNAAIYSYGGQVYKALDPLTISEDRLANIYIFSALYGLLNAFDKISNYRLDYTNKIMQETLYTFWGRKINDHLIEISKDKIIINLASREFTETIDQDLNNLYHIDFIVKNSDEIIRPSMLIKTMRGLFSRAILINDINNLIDLKSLSINGFNYSEQLSKNNVLTFIREEN